ILKSLIMCHFRFGYINEMTQISKHYQHQSVFFPNVEHKRSRDISAVAFRTVLGLPLLSL
ncbi:hypothetical protein, partial [Alteromonas sp. ASW11-130]|uniref:hypothetical protein n=1 Tax=Alteromonas sp. ASW11-130 TaxID=3015775 RepID=UPI002241934C